MKKSQSIQFVENHFNYDLRRNILYKINFSCLFSTFSTNVIDKRERVREREVQYMLNN